jgi:hypothetical protein
MFVLDAALDIQQFLGGHMKIKVGDTVGEFKKLDSTPPPGHKPASVMTMEAVIDTTPQPLRVLRPFITACQQISTILPGEAQIVLQALFSCFERQKSVNEGLIGDLVWGFAQCGIAHECTWIGLQELVKLGYIKFQAPDGEYIEPTSDQIAKAFVRYQPPLLRMVYE